MTFNFQIESIEIDGTTLLTSFDADLADSYTLYSDPDGTLEREEIHCDTPVPARHAFRSWSLAEPASSQRFLQDNIETPMVRNLIERSLLTLASLFKLLCSYVFLYGGALTSSEDSTSAGFSGSFLTPRVPRPRVGLRHFRGVSFCTYHITTGAGSAAPFLFAKSTASIAIS